METDRVTDFAVTPFDVAKSFMAKAPVDLEGMAAALGIRVNMNAVMDDPSHSGSIRRASGGDYVIDINGEDSAKRKHFTLAHEISHFLLHRDLLDNGGVVDNAMYRSNLSDSKEWEANRLAAELLMPKDLVRTLWKTGVRSVYQLASIFEASEPAVRIRLKQLGYSA